MTRAPQLLLLFVLLEAGCTDDFSHFKFGKNPPRTHDAGALNVSGRTGSVDAGTSQSRLQQAGTGVAGGGHQVQGAGNAADSAPSLSDRDD